MEVLSPGQRPTKRGLIYAATPASDFVCGTQQVASGITVQVFTTGRGTPYGLDGGTGDQNGDPHRAGKNRWYDLMDINAGTIATGEESIEEGGLEAVPLHSGCGKRAEENLLRSMGIACNSLAVFNPAPVT